MARSLWPSTDSVRPASTEHFADWIRVEGVRSRENWKYTQRTHKAILTIRDLAYQDWRMPRNSVWKHRPGKVKNPIQTTRRLYVGRHIDKNKRNTRSPSDYNEHSSWNCDLLWLIFPVHPHWTSSDTFTCQWITHSLVSTHAFGNHPLNSLTGCLGYTTVKHPKTELERLFIVRCRFRAQTAHSERIVLFTTQSPCSRRYNEDQWNELRFQRYKLTFDTTKPKANANPLSENDLMRGCLTFAKLTKKHSCGEL